MSDYPPPTHTAADLPPQAAVYIAQSHGQAQNVSAASSYPAATTTTTTTSTGMTITSTPLNTSSGNTTAGPINLTTSSPYHLTRHGELVYNQMEKVNSELVSLLYGSFVASLCQEYDDVQLVNAELEKMGTYMGKRMMEEFLAKGQLNQLTLPFNTNSYASSSLAQDNSHDSSNSSDSSDDHSSNGHTPQQGGTFIDVLHVLSQIGLKMFLGVSSEVKVFHDANTGSYAAVSATNENSSNATPIGHTCSLIIRGNPLTEFVQLPTFNSVDDLTDQTAAQLNIQKNKSHEYDFDYDYDEDEAEDDDDEDEEPSKHPDANKKASVLTGQSAPLPSSSPATSSSSQAPHLDYHAVLKGAIQGALEMIQLQVDAQIIRDELQGHPETEIKLTLKQVLADEYAADEDE